MIETILLCTIFGVFILFSYTLGLRNGQKLKKDEPIKLPEVTEKIKEITKVNSKVDDGLSKEEQISWENINNYDGTIESQRRIESR